MRGKRWLLLAAAGLWMAEVLSAAALAEETVYLRVIGRDDTPQGQAEKLRVRDAVLAACPESWTDPERLLEEAARAAGGIADCRIEVRVWQPPQGMPPARTLYVTVGEGRGRNWWGILYGDAAQMVSEEADGEETGCVWPVWEWLKRLLGL